MPESTCALKSIAKAKAKAKGYLIKRVLVCSIILTMMFLEKDRKENSWYKERRIDVPRDRAYASLVCFLES